MTLNTLFRKDVNRAIETVIKADDQEHILTEVEEYVITREVAKMVTNFFAAYTDYQGANGVWISGFFGSGKSHLLKILSYVLENKAYDDKRLGEIFANKIEDDEMLRGDVLKATRIPAESILFNIDQQAQITSKGDQDAILKVFYKVFYDHCGYFGAQRHVAEFERWLDREGKYLPFIDLYEKHAGQHWVQGRRTYFAPGTKKAIGLALSEINGDDPEHYADIIDTLRKDAVTSVEDFCEKVAEYIDQKGPDFRLNFFVDEAGQFISGNTKLMLNLQTIAETLATKCRGRAWVFATAQEDLEAIVGDDSAVNSDDFSKIQGRFNLRIPLTSANVDEVIEKRLLAKTDDARKLLDQQWSKEKDNLRTLLTFSEAGVQFRHYQGDRDFISKFPFIPYQFDLFQQCIRELSKHNAFQGRHASVGERSMLGVFQEVLQALHKTSPDTLVSFDQMFEGLRSTIRGQIQNAISLAERNLTNKMAIRVLKALFLVKYYDQFKTTARNISVLMLRSTKVDLKAHEQAVQEALNILENQTYVQRNGEVYVFLTDEEKDVENEIKSTEIDNQQVTHFFNEALFDHVIGENRIRFQENRQDYEFTKMIDGAVVGREKELAIEILTPNSEYYDQPDKENYFKSHTMGQGTLLLFVLPPAERLLQDVRLYLKTEKYYKQATSSANNASLNRILVEKQQQNVQRRRQLIRRLRELLGRATVYLNGAKQEIGHAGDGKTKVVNAFQDLVRVAYPNLRMLGSIPFSDDTLKSIMRAAPDALFQSDDASMSEGESEVYNYIMRRKTQGERTSLADLRDYFSRKPYGWYASATLSMVARLYKRGKVEARQDANLLNDSDLLANLLNSRSFGNTLLEPQQEFNPQLLRRLKEVYQELFDENPPAGEARDIATAFKEKAQAKSRELLRLLGQKDQYPFLNQLEPLANTLDRLAGMDYHVLIRELAGFEDELLDQKEGILDPLLIFWRGDQKRIFDQINDFLNGDQSNFEYVDSAELEQLRALRQDPQPYRGNTMREAKAAMEALKKKVLDRIDAEKNNALAAIEKGKSELTGQPDFSALNEEQQARVLRPLEDMTRRVKEQRYIATLRQFGNQVNDRVAEQLGEYQRLLQPDEPVVEYITIKNVHLKDKPSELRTEADVDTYLEQLKAELLRHLHENRRIKL